jgi:hypothetical protein
MVGDSSMNMISALVRTIFAKFGKETKTNDHAYQRDKKFNRLKRIHYAEMIV